MLQRLTSVDYLNPIHETHHRMCSEFGIDDQVGKKYHEEFFSILEHIHDKTTKHTYQNVFWEFYKSEVINVKRIVYNEDLHYVLDKFLSGIKMLDKLPVTKDVEYHEKKLIKSAIDSIKLFHGFYTSKPDYLYNPMYTQVLINLHEFEKMNYRFNDMLRKSVSSSESKVLEIVE